MENSAGDFKREVILPASVEIPVKDEKVNEPAENIFQHFHDKYLKLKSLASNSSETNSGTNQESKELLESIIEELSESIKDNYENHESFLRLLGMKTFLQHILSKVLSENESQTLLEKVYGESKPYLANPEVVYSGFLIINSLSALTGKLDNSLDKVKDILEECQIVYKKLKQTNKDDNYYTGNELFSPEKRMSSNRDAKLKYEKLVVTNLLFLGSIYEKLGDHYKDTVCYHTAFNRMLNQGLVSPFKWVDFTTRLACVFIDDNNFKDARHHLSAATHVHEMLEVKNASINDTSTKELIKSNSVHLALAWVRYCVLLFEKSKDEDRRKFSSLFKNGYLYPNSRPIEKSIMNDQYKSHFLNDKNIAFQNPRFMETIDKEIDVDCSDYERINEDNNIVFGDFLDIVKSHLNETNDQGKDELEINPENSYDLINKNTDEKHNNNCEILISSEKKSGDHEKMRNEAADNSDSKLISDKTSDRMKKSEHIESDTKTENMTKEDLNKNSVKEEPEKNGNNDKELIFSSLGYLPVEQSVTKDPIQTPEQAKKLFTFAYRWSKQAQLFYPKTSDFYSYVQVILNLVSLHRLCAYFQGRDNLEYRISLEQTRENLLEHLVTELSEIQPENHLHVRLYQEMALLNIDLAMLNMCNIYNIHADDTYKLFALAELQSHINHIYIVGDMLERSTNIFEKKKHNEKSSIQKTDSENVSAN